MTEPPKPPRQKVVFGLQPLEEGGGPNVLDEEREKHRKRAEKFGVAYKEPAKVRHDLQLEAKRERLARPGFVTGFDFFSEEEVRKRAERAKKFGLVTASTAAAAAANGEQDDMQTDELLSDPAALANLGRPAAARTVAAEVEATAEELRKRVARGEKFGLGEFDVKAAAEKALLLSPEDADLFVAREEAALTDVRRKDRIYLYGVDYMSTHDCLAYFEDYGPSFIEWINDSACLVVFSDEATTLRAMMGRGQPIPPDIAPPPEGEPGMPGPKLADLSASDPASAPYLWFRGADYMLQGRKPIKLIYRMAITLDYKDPHKAKESRYLWQRRGRHQRHGGGDDYGSGSGRKRQRQRRRDEGYGGGYGDDYGDPEGMDWEGGEEDYGDGQYQQQQQRMGGPRGGRKARRKRMKGGAGGDDGGWEEVDMEDAEDAEDYGALIGGTGKQPRLRSTITSAGDGTEGAAAAVPEEGAPSAATDGAQDLRDVLHRVHEASAPPPVPAVGDDDFEEVPQPDDDDPAPEANQ